MAEDGQLPAGALGEGMVLAGRYRLGRQLGRGGMGVVWHAFDLKLRVDVALKSLYQLRCGDDKSLAMARREVRAAREVVSPNVCRIFDLVEVDGRELVSMEYIDGVTLLDVLQERGPLELKEAQDIASQFLAGLEAIHRSGLVHRDVKPENIMITRAGRVVLMDFGLAREESSGSGTIAGTPAYMAPEQVAGMAVDARADVYAAGVVLAEMISPEGVRDIISRKSLWEGVRTEPAVVPDTPWAPIIRKAVAKDREHRQGTAHTLIRELEDVTLRFVDAEELHPYPGLASFTEDDTEFFFGREAEIEAMWSKLAGPARLLGLVGPSGAGKTSFLRAGVIPNATSDWSIVHCTPGPAPMPALRRALVTALGGDAEALAAIATGDEEATVSACSHWRRAHDRVLLVVDQFEELFTLNPPATQARFADLLNRLPLEADVHVLLSMRDDFLMDCNGLEPLRSLVSDLTLLDPPAGASLRRALVQPATRCGYRFENDELVDEMLNEVAGERGALPLLAFAAAQLWERRDREGGILTSEAYATIGGVAGALARHADATMEEIGTERAEMVRELFRNLVTAEGTRAVREQNELLSVFDDADRGDAAAVLNALVDARLLTSYETSEEGREPRRQVEIIHESLLANWPRLKRWQTQDADAAQLRDQLRQAARTWHENDRINDLLWTGTAYRQFAVWQESYSGGLSAVEQGFARAMAHHAARRKRRRRSAVAAVLAVALAVAALATTLWRRSEQQTLRAEGARLLAIARLELDEDSTVALAWATASLELADTPEARRLVVEALWRGPTRFEVEPTEGRPMPANIDFGPDGDFLAANSFSSDELLVWSENGGAPRIVGSPEKTRYLGSVVTSETETGEPVILQYVGATIKLWSVPELELLREIEEDANWTRVAFGKIVAFLEQDDGYLVQSWPFDRSEPTTHGRWQSEGARQPWTDVRGEWLVFARGRELVRRPLEHVESEQYDEILARHPADIVSYSFGFKGDHIAVLDTTGVVRLWSWAPDPLHPLAALRGPSRGFRSDPTGTLLHAGSGDERVLRFWDTTAPPDAEPLVIPMPQGGGIGLGTCVHPERRWLVGQGGGTLFFWPLGGRHPRVLKGHSSQISALTFLPDGSRLVSASRRSIRLWPLSTASGEFASELIEGTLNLNGVAADPSGNTLLIARWFYTGVHRMELATGSAELLWPPGAGIVYDALGFSPDGQQAAAAAMYAFKSENMVMRVWDTATWSERVLDLRDAEWSGAYDGEYLGGVGSLQFTPDGRLLTSGSGGIRLWDLDTGETEWIVRTVNDRWMGLSADRSGRYLLTAETVAAPNALEAEDLTLHDRATGTSRAITTHGEKIFPAVLDPTGTIIVTSGPGEGVIQVGSTDGSEPHLLFGHGRNVTAIAVSPDSRWIASGDEFGEIRLWPMPDVSSPPLHTLPHDELMAKLKTLTNLRVVRDAASGDDWKIETAPFRGWMELPEW